MKIIEGNPRMADCVETGMRKFIEDLFRLRREYLVCYIYKGPEGERVEAYVGVTRRGPISTIYDVYDIGKAILDRDGRDPIIIRNIQRLPI